MVTMKPHVFLRLGYTSLEQFYFGKGNELETYNYRI